jgi:hypothetical protein
MPLNKPVKTAVDRSVHSTRFDAVYSLQFVEETLAAGLANTAVVARVSLPLAAKIPVVQVSFIAIDSLAGTDKFNIVVGEGAETGTVGPVDNTDVSGTPWAVGQPIASGYAAAGNGLFKVDQAITATAGVGAPANQPALAAVTTGTGGVLRFITDAPDTIYPAGTVLTLRAVTTASTGEITSLVVSLDVIPVLPVQGQPVNGKYISAGLDY